MDKFSLRHLGALVAMGVLGTIFWFLPEDQRVQFAGPFAGGLLMVLISSFLHNPRVQIEGLGEEIHFHLNQNNTGEAVCWIEGILVNRSATGQGDLKSLFLRILLNEKDWIDVPAGYGQYLGFRFQPNGRHPLGTLRFVTRIAEKDWSSIAGQTAQIHYDVIGQSHRKYTTKMEDIVGRMVRG